MGTVGLSFGAATSGQGFDVASTVTQIQASEQAIETPWKTQLTALQAQDTVFTSLGSDLSTLTTSLQALTDFQGTFAEKQGSSSNTDLLSLTSADATSVAGSHTIVINSLAQTSSEVSSAISDASDTLSGSVTIQGQEFDIDSSDNTLSTLSAAINAADIGVKASVITDSSGFTAFVGKWNEWCGWTIGGYEFAVGCCFGQYSVSGWADWTGCESDGGWSFGDEFVEHCE